MGVFETRVRVDVRRTTPGPPDRFGDTEWVWGEWEQVEVFGWAVPTSEVTTSGEVVLRDSSDLELYCPPSVAPGPGGQVRLPDGRVFTTAPAAHDYSHNPWFDPGLVVVPLTRVEG